MRLRDMFKRAVIMSLIFMLVACSNKSTQKLSLCNNTPDDPFDWVKNLAQEKNFPGLAVAVGVKDEIIWTHGYGLADVAKAAPIDPETTKFRIGSTSKALTGFALARLSQDDALDLHGKLPCWGDTNSDRRASAWKCVCFFQQSIGHGQAKGDSFA